MSTIASPRDPSALRRTPSSSARPSIDSHRSTVTSPVTSQNPTQPPPPPNPSSSSSQQGSGGGGGANSKRAKRAALREYYNLRAAADTATPATPSLRIELLSESEVPPSDIDAADFDADEYVARVVAESSLEQLLRLYTRVLGEVRALDAEKKALVYDNYSKLITATETIRKMRTNMDPLNPMASTLDPAIAQIYSQASSIREALRASIPPPDSDESKAQEAEARKKRTRDLAAEALATPGRLRALVKEGRVEEARAQWEMPRRLLVSWKEKGVGGDDVQGVINEGDAALSPGSGSTTPEDEEDEDEDET